MKYLVEYTIRGTNQTQALGYDDADGFFALSVYFQKTKDKGVGSAKFLVDGKVKYEYVAKK